MRATFYIDSQKDFDAWFANKAAPAVATRRPARLRRACRSRRDARPASAVVIENAARALGRRFLQSSSVPGLGKIFAIRSCEARDGTAATPDDAAGILKNG